MNNFNNFKAFATILFCFVFSAFAFAQDCTVTEECAIFRLDKMIEEANGDMTYVFEVEVDANGSCKNAVSHVSFELPAGFQALSPSHNAIYTSPLTGIQYVVENGTNNPFYSIKFNVKDGFEGIKRGQKDKFKYTIPATAVSSMERNNGMKVEAKIGKDAFITSMAADCISSLPVELSSFDATEENGHVVLTWRAETEEAFSHYEIQRSNDAVRFQAIDDVTGVAGARGADYTYTDRTAASRNYYRLKMIDLDGSFEYSRIVQINLEAKKVAVKIFPNPTVNKVNISFEAMGNRSTVSISNINGQIIRNQVFDTNNGDSVQATFEAEDLVAGTYIVMIDNDGDRSAQKFIKK